MATKAVKILDKNFHISLKLNDLPISVAVGIGVDTVLGSAVLPSKTRTAKGSPASSVNKPTTIWRLPFFPSRLEPYAPSSFCSPSRYSMIKFFVLDVLLTRVVAVSTDPASHSALAPSFFGRPPGQLPR